MIAGADTRTAAVEKVREARMAVDLNMVDGARGVVVFFCAGFRWGLEGGRDAVAITQRKKFQSPILFSSAQATRETAKNLYIFLECIIRG